MNIDDWTTDSCLFVFGSLMDPDVLEIVSGMGLSDLEVSAATAPGYLQCEIAEESFPVLVNSDAGNASGLLIRRLNLPAVKRILFFEGDEYCLEPIAVVSAQVQGISAFYFRATGVYTVRETMWDFALWSAQHKPGFVDATLHYMDLYGKMSTKEADAHWQNLTSDDREVDHESVRLARVV